MSPSNDAIVNIGFGGVTVLKTTKITVSEVGYAVGFNDPAYFARCFKQQYGASPSEFLSN